MLIVFIRNRLSIIPKKLLSFEGYCEFKSDRIFYKIKLRKLYNYNVYLTEKLQSKYNCSSSDKLDMKIVFITNLQNQSYKHYLHEPKQMIEWFPIEKTNQNPNLVKMFDKLFLPITRKVTINNWGSQKTNGIENCFIP